MRIAVISEKKPVPKDTRRLIEEIVKRMDRGDGTVSIAKKLGVDPGFVMQAAMIRVTHPGMGAVGFCAPPLISPTNQNLLPSKKF